MKTFLSFVLLAMTFTTSAFATSGSNGLPLPAEIKGRVSRQAYQGVDLGIQLVSKKVQLMKALYSYAVHGGTSGLQAKLKDVDGKDAVLPRNAIVKQVLVDTLIAPTASAVAGFTAPLISLDLNVPGDLKAASAATGFTGRQAGIPIGTAATMVKALGTSAVTAKITGGSVLSGKFNVFIEYYLSD